MRLFWLVRPTIFLLISFAFILLIISFYLVLSDGHVKSYSNSLTNAFNSLNRVHMDSKKNTRNEELNIMFLFSKAEGNKQLQSSFRLCLTSLLTKAANPQAIHFYIMGDMDSYSIAKSLIHNLTNKIGIYHEPMLAMITYQNSSQLEGNVLDIIQKVHQQLSSGKEHLFSNSLFYLSIVLHKIMPHNISRILVLDVDLVIDSDISELFSLFDDFSQEQAIGIARENQPVYQNVLWEYRKNNPGTRVGEPPPGGLTGFNSGVVLFDLDKLRRSSKYNAFLTEQELTMLVKKYHFQGHLGDQDFFTLLSFEYEELFYILPCGWNRQLCSWWKHNGLGDIFDLYYNCTAPVHIWHGNCKTSLLNYTSIQHKFFASAEDWPY